MRSRLIIAALLSAAAARADYIDLYADKLDMPRNKAPRVGRSNVLVVPVQIDLPGFPPLDMDRLHAFFEGARSWCGELHRRPSPSRSAAGAPEVVRRPIRSATTSERDVTPAHHRCKPWDRLRHPAPGRRARP